MMTIRLRLFVLLVGAALMLAGAAGCSDDDGPGDDSRARDGLSDGPGTADGPLDGPRDSTPADGDGSVDDGSPGDGAPGDRTPSDSGCGDTQSDPLNCGQCGKACTGGRACLQGQCECAPYLKLCGGQCIPVVNDPTNCGDCNVTCSGTAGVCSGGKCSATCLPGLTDCSGACLDTNSDNANCGTCGNACGSGQGCVNGSCQSGIGATTLPKCVGGGPPINVGTAAQPGPCGGLLAQTTFTWALCSCNDVNVPGNLATDSFDSTKGPYVAPGGLGAGVGVNDVATSPGNNDIRGALWSAGSAGLAVNGNNTVHQILRVNGNLKTANFGVERDAYVNGAVQGNTLDIKGTLYLPSGKGISGTVNRGATVRQPVSIAPPCDRCPNDAAYIDVAAIVTARASSNDNSKINLTAGALTSPQAPQRVDLPCGHYYLSGIKNINPLTIVAHGRTALYIDGDVDATAALHITVMPAGELDVFISGTLKASGSLKLGSANYPALMRVYIGGTGQVLLTGNADLSTNIYAPNATVQYSGSSAIYGAIYAGDFKSNGDTTIHYDRGVGSAGATCPPPSGGGSTTGPDGGLADGSPGDGPSGDGLAGDGATSDSAVPGNGCTSCKDCGNQACVNGTCGKCTSDSQCCAPLICHVPTGTCLYVIN